MSHWGKWCWDGGGGGGGAQLSPPLILLSCLWGAVFSLFFFTSSLKRVAVVPSGSGLAPNNSGGMVGYSYMVVMHDALCACPVACVVLLYFFLAESVLENASGFVPGLK